MFSLSNSESYFHEAGPNDLKIPARPCHNRKSRSDLVMWNHCGYSAHLNYLLNVRILFLEDSLGFEVGILVSRASFHVGKSKSKISRTPSRDFTQVPTTATLNLLISSSQQ